MTRKAITTGARAYHTEFDPTLQKSFSVHRDRATDACDRAEAVAKVRVEQAETPIVGGNSVPRDTRPRMHKTTSQHRSM